MSSPGTEEMNTNVSKARCSQELKHNKKQNAILTRKTKALGAVEFMCPTWELGCSAQSTPCYYRGYFLKKDS